MKEFLGGLFAYLTEMVMHIPFWTIRRLWLKIFMKRLSPGCFIARNVDIRKPANISLGSNVVVNKHVLLDGRGGELIIGDNTDIAQETNIWTLSHDINNPQHAVFGRPVIIEEHCWIGARSSILPGVTVGKGAVVGTCSVVTRDVEPETVVAGNPAHRIGLRSNPLLYQLNFHPWFQ